MRDKHCNGPLSHSKRPKIYLDDLIRGQKWDTVRGEILSANSRRLRSRFSNKIACNRRCSSTALALAVSLDSPSDVVASLLSLDPVAASRPDRRGRLPLHVACSAGASIDVVNLLLLGESSTADNEIQPEGNFDAALCADDDGRVPRHYAADYVIGSYGDTLDVVAVLSVACPAAAFTKDARCETPCDVFYAVVQMEDAASLDSDGEMVRAARVVARILLQKKPVISRRRESRIGRRATATANELGKLRRSAFGWQEGRRDVLSVDTEQYRKGQLE